MKKTCTEIHYFFCPECGAITPLARKISKQKEKFHKKKLYCYKCKREVNQVECKNQIELNEFKEKNLINSEKKILYILSGVPASGKSTWAKLKVEMEPNVAWVSRDEIRFKIMKQYEIFEGVECEYFAHENEVFCEYVKTIQEHINQNCPQIIADATQINERSRKKLLNRLDLKDYEIRIILFLDDIDICKIRNEHRIGKEKVSEQVINNMYDSLMQSNTYEEAYLIIRKGIVV